MSHFVIDTNVLVVADLDLTQKNRLDCAARCARRLEEIKSDHAIVLDWQKEILTEYRRALTAARPSAGGKFLKWLFTVQFIQRHCSLVNLVRDHRGEYLAFPRDVELERFDEDDRKFVAAALVHSTKPPVVNAVDSDWWHYQEVLARHEVRVEQLCPEQFESRGVHPPPRRREPNR